MDIEQYILDGVRKYQAKLTDEQRLDFWSAIREGFCQICGRPLAADEPCQCWNDE